MPHAILHTPLQANHIAAQFQSQRHQQGEMFISLDEMFQSTQNNALLVEAYIHEEALTQRVGLTLHWREGHKLIIGLHEFGFPRPTPGVQFDIYCLTHWLKSLHPDNKILHHNLSPTVTEERNS